MGHSCGETRSATASTLLSIAKLSAMLSSPSPCPSDPPSSSSSSSAIARARAKLRVSSGVKSIAKDNNTRSKHLYSSRSDAAREASANLAVLAAHSTILREDSRYCYLSLLFLSFSVLRHCSIFLYCIPPFFHSCLSIISSIFFFFLLFFSFLTSSAASSNLFPFTHPESSLRLTSLLQHLE